MHICPTRAMRKIHRPCGLAYADVADTYQQMGFPMLVHTHKMTHQLVGRSTHLKFQYNEAIKRYWITSIFRICSLCMSENALLYILIREIKINSALGDNIFLHLISVLPLENSIKLYKSVIKLNILIRLLLNLFKTNVIFRGHFKMLKKRSFKKYQ